MPTEAQHLRRVMPLALFAVAVAMGSATIGHPAAASAKPNSPGFHDQLGDCINNSRDPDWNRKVEACCVQLNGWVVEDPSHNAWCLDHAPDDEECAYYETPACLSIAPPVNDLPTLTPTVVAVKPPLAR